MNEKEAIDSGPSPPADFQQEAESERAITIELLRLFSQRTNWRESLRAVTSLLREWSHCEAVGIRLREGEDFPYFETHGFPPEFVLAENRLCEVDLRGKTQRDSEGNPVLECMCGNVIRGRFDPSKPFFTAHGSFWTNSTSELLASTTEADRQAHTRNRCTGEGYESVALIPLRAAGETFGLLQLNDRGRGRFTPRGISFLECLADSVALGLAQRKVEDSLRESTARLERAVQAGNVGLWEWDLRTDRMFFSPQWKRQIGYEEQEIGNDFSDWQNRVHPDDLARCLSTLKAFVEKPWSDFRLEYRFRHKDGSYRWILTQASPSSDDHGQVVRMLGSHIDITDRKRAEETLRVNEEFQRDVINALGAHIAVLDGQGTIIAVNAAWEQFAHENGAEHSARTGVGSNYLDVCRNAPAAFHDEAIAAMEGIQAVLRRERTSFWLEYPCHSPEVKRWFLMHATPLCSRPGGVIVSHIDITARKQAELDMRESENRYRSLFNGMTEGFGLHEILCDQDGTPCDYRFLEVNPAFEDLTGLKRAEIVGRTLREVLPHEGAQWVETYGKVALTGKSIRFEEHSSALDKYFDVFAYSPAPRQFAVLFRDVTERKRMELALRESEERLRLAAQAAKFGTFNYDFLTHTAYWSPEFKALFGLAPDAPFDMDADHLPLGVHPDDRAAAMAGINASRDPRGSGLLDVEHRVIHPDGSVRWISLQGRVLFSGVGEARHPVRADGTVLDVTDRRRAEEALRESMRREAEAEKLAATGRMAAQVAHEINNPLAGIKNSFRLIRDAVPNDHPDYDMVGRIERELDRIAHIVRQMYLIYTPQVGEPSGLPVGETVCDVLVMLEPLCREHEATVEVGDIPPELAVRVHAGNLQQVLYNLTANAIQASPCGGVVRIAAEPVAEGFVRISVHDQGPGVPVEVRDRIFEPFVSAASGTTPKQGLGLGLAIVKGIVDSIGGRIDFESTAGEGTCFRVYLPSKQP